MINLRNVQMVKINVPASSTVRYAIRRGWIFHSYLDLSPGWFPTTWWSDSEIFFARDCTSNDYEKVKTVFLNLDRIRLRPKIDVIKNP